MQSCSKARIAPFLVAAGLVSLAVGLATAAEAPADEPFDVVDISFLVPPSEKSIRIAGNEGRQPILSKRLFDKLEDFIKRGHPDVEDPYAKLIVTAFRFDPCGPVYPADWDIKKCVLPNIRLIAQVYDKGRVTSAALHMVFSLGVKVNQDRASIQRGLGFNPDARSKVVRDLRQMKARNAASGIVTNGVSLGIHPAFSESHRNSARTCEFESELDQFVRALASEDAYFTTAIMFAVHPSSLPDAAELEGKERWVWQKANIVRRNLKTGLPLEQLEFVFGGIPGFDPNQKEQVLTAKLENRSEVDVSPSSTIENGGVPNLAIAAILKNSSEFDWGRLQRAVDVADTLDNPNRSLVSTDDCVSCHVSSTARSYALKDGRLGWIKRSNEFRFDATDAALTSSLTPADASWQSAAGYRVMSLGFFKGSPSIGQRVVNETLQAAHLLRLIQR